MEWMGLKLELLLIKLISEITFSMLTRLPPHCGMSHSGSHSCRAVPDSGLYECVHSVESRWPPPNSSTKD